MTDAVKSTKKQRQQDFDTQIKASFKHNLITLVLFECVWWMGFGIVIPAIFIPSYLNTLEAPKTLIGIVAALYFLTMPLNFLVDNLPTRIPRKILAACGYSSLGIIYIITGSLSLFFDSPAALITIITVAMIFFFSICNIIVPLHFEICTDNIPKKKRGLAFTLRVVFAGISGLTSTLIFSSLATNINSELHASQISLIAAGIIYSLAILVLLRVKDHVDPTRKIRRKRNYKISFFKNNILLITKLWYRPNYRVMVFFTIILLASGLLGTFMVTAAQDTLHMDMEQLQDNLRPMFMGVLVVGALVVGPIADRWGFLSMMTILGVCIAIGHLLMLFPSKISFFIAYNFNVCGVTFIGMAITNLCLEMLPNIRTGRLIAATNLFCLPINFVVPWIFGGVIDSYKISRSINQGYNMTFLVGFVLAIIATFGFICIVQEPRGGRELTYRFFRRA